MDTSIGHDKRAPYKTFSFVEPSDCHLDKSMTQTLDASPVKPDVSNDYDSDDLHVVGGTREIPSGVQSATSVPPSNNLLIASYDVASHTDQI